MLIFLATHSLSPWCTACTVLAAGGLGVASPCSIGEGLPWFDYTSTESLESCVSYEQGFYGLQPNVSYWGYVQKFSSDPAMLSYSLFHCNIWTLP